MFIQPDLRAMEDREGLSDEAASAACKEGDQITEVRVRFVILLHLSWVDFI